MTLMVDVEAAMLALRYDGETDAVEQAVVSATSVLMEYLTETAEFTDSHGDLIPDSHGVALDVPDALRRCCIALTGILLTDPTGSDLRHWAGGDMPPVVRSLARPWRVPTIG